MPQREVTNIIIKLREMGYSAEQINAFIVFIETHTPTEEEAQAIFEDANE